MRSQKNSSTTFDNSSIWAADRCFALTFGHTHHNLKEECFEYDFGLRTTLNAIDPHKLKSTDILQPGNAKRQRTQSPAVADLTFFDFDRDESVIKNLSGKVKEEYKELFLDVTGASNLRISTKLQPSKLIGLCKSILEIYKKEDYKENFPDIQNVVPIKDPQKIAQLNAELLEAFKNDSIDLVMTVPEIVDYQSNDYYKFRGAGKSRSLYEDVYIANYREYLSDNNLTEIDIDVFKKHKLQIVDENGHTRKEASIFRCFLFDCKVKTEHFHLCDRHWYRIEDDYIKVLQNELDPFFRDSFLPNCTEKKEQDYNSKVSEENNEFICLDGKNISPSGQSQVEPCDLFTTNEETAVFCHIKISTRSSTLSHLFNQGHNSIALIKTEITAFQKLQELVRLTNGNSPLPLENKKFEVVFGIITKKNPANKSDNLPIFSRISLRRVIRSLSAMDVKPTMIFIKDDVNRKVAINQ
jgi:uncharacterized protein (TIGR04141 family)